MRSIWSGSISFGLINIPVKLYSATEERALNFDLLHKKDLSPIRFARVCLADEKEVPYKDLVKGYEYQKGEYVVLNEEDFKNAIQEKTGNISILHFAKSGEIESVYYEKPYFLEPGKGADKAYALLLEALRESDKVAVVKFVFRNKEHLGILKPYLNAIVLNQMRFQDEVRAVTELKLPKKDMVEKKDMEMALKLVNQLTEKFHPEKHHDNYTEELKTVIESKIKGVKYSHKKTSPKVSKIHDITALLEASLAEGKKQKTTITKRKTKPKIA